MKKKVLMVVFSHYPDDPRVRRESEALEQDGMQVGVICLQKPLEPKRETVKGIEVYRLSTKRSRGSKFAYIKEYLSFLLLAFCKVSLLYLRERYSVIHAHNMPDILVFTGLVPRLFGAKVVLDLHDPMPEVYMAKYGLKKSHFITRTLLTLENLSIRFSSLVITPNKAFLDLFVSRGCPKNKIIIVMNSPQESIFLPSRHSASAFFKHAGSYTIMYHGTIVERHGLDTALQALKIIRETIPNVVFKVCGNGDFVDRFLEMRTEMDLAESVQYMGFVRLEKIPEMIQNCDVGIVPNKRNPFTEINLPTRIFEYICLGKPVVAPRTRGVLDYFNDDTIFLFEPDSVESLATAVLRIHADQNRTSNIVHQGQIVYENYQWSKQKTVLLKHIRKL